MFKVRFIFETKASYITASDEELVAAAKIGQEEAFELLAARMKMLILHYTARYRNRDELYQNALILLYESVMDYEAEKCHQFKPYYLKLLGYRVIDWLRHERRMNQPNIVSLYDTANDTRMLVEEICDYKQCSPEQTSLYNELLSHINPVSLGLSALEYRLAQALLNGETIEEFANRERRTEYTVRNASNRLKKKVLSQLIR